MQHTMKATVRAMMTVPLTAETTMAMRRPWLSGLGSPDGDSDVVSIVSVIGQASERG